MASVAPAGDNGMGGHSPSDENPGLRNSLAAAAVGIAILVGVFVLAKVTVAVSNCMDRDAAIPRSCEGLQFEMHGSKTRRLKKADLDALPLVRLADLCQIDDHECLVCLMDFEAEENLRLLPSCKHVFHQDCIDLWFDAHSTCPLCRASLLSGHARPNATPVVNQVAQSAPVASEADVQSTMSKDAPTAESRCGRGAPGQSSAMITREDKHSSANGALFQNSESFKCVVGGVEAYESAAAEAASEKNPKSLTGSDSVCRSSPPDTDMVTLRLLLMSVDQNASSAFGSTREFDCASRSETEARDRAAQSERTHSGRDEWVTVDLETGNATPALADPSTTLSRGESSKDSAPEGSWSDRFSLSGLKSLRGIAIFSRPSSDTSWRDAPHPPI